MDKHRNCNLGKCVAFVMSIVAFVCVIGLIVMATEYSSSTCPPEIRCFQHQSRNVLEPDPIRFPNKVSFAKKINVKQSGRSTFKSEIYNSPDNIQDIAQPSTKRTDSHLLYSSLEDISDEFLSDEDDAITIFADFSSEEPTLEPEGTSNVINSFDNRTTDTYNSPDNIQDIAQHSTEITDNRPLYSSLEDISDEFLSDEDDAITIFADFSSEEPTLDPEENLNVSNSFDNSMEKNSYDFPFSGSVSEIPLRRKGKSMLNEQFGIHETDSQRSHETDRNIKIQPDAIVINDAEIAEKVLSSTPSQIDAVDVRMKMLGFLELVSRLKIDPAEKHDILNFLLSKIDQQLKYSNPSSVGNTEKNNKPGKI